MSTVSSTKAPPPSHCQRNAQLAIATPPKNLDLRFTGRLARRSNRFGFWDQVLSAAKGQQLFGKEQFGHGVGTLFLCTLGARRQIGELVAQPLLFELVLARFKNLLGPRHFKSRQLPAVLLRLLFKPSDTGGGFGESSLCLGLFALFGLFLFDLDTSL